MFPTDFDIIDISQPVSSKTACFPGDVPFSRSMTVTYEQSRLINLTAVTFSPHVGTHTDAPVHVKGTMSDERLMAGMLPLASFVGPACVIDISQLDAGGIGEERLRGGLEQYRRQMRLSGHPEPPPARYLIKTQTQVMPEEFKDDYPYFELDGIQYLYESGAVLVGLDTPSVDQVRSKTLAAHHALIEREIWWLENLDLSNVEAGLYFLVAAPIKLTEAEAAPIRAILLKERSAM